MSGRLNASRHPRDKIGSWAFPPRETSWKKVSKRLSCILLRYIFEKCLVSSLFFSISLIVLGKGSRVYVLFFLSGENCPLNVKLSNSSKKIQVNETSAQIWENIHPSFHLIRKIIR